MSNDDYNNNYNDDNGDGGEQSSGSNTQHQQHQTQQKSDGDKPYTREQIAKLLEFSDLRTKTTILLMSSSGTRIGALPPLKVGDLNQGIRQFKE